MIELIGFDDFMKVDVRVGRLVLAVVNFPPRQNGPFRSEVLTLGTYRGESVLLISPERDAQPGDRLG